MIVDVPFHYEVEVKMPRSPKILTVVVHDVQPVSIPQVDGAVLVARYKNSSNKIVPVEAWHLNGKFWRPCTSGADTDAGKQVITPQEYFESLAKSGNGGNGPAIFGTRVPHRTQEFDSIEAIGARVVCSSTRDQVVADMEKAASSVMVTGDRVLRESSEPLMRGSHETHHYNGRTSHWIRVDVEGVDEARSKSARMQMWRLDEFDRMVASIRATTTVDLGEVAYERPEILRPDLLTWDREREVLWESIDSDVSRHKNQHKGFADATIADFCAFAMLRDHASSCDRTTDEAAHRAGELVSVAKRDCVGNEWYAPFERSAEAYTEFVDQRVLQAAPDAAEALTHLSI